jgi:hypothetical protein
MNCESEPKIDGRSRLKTPDVLDGERMANATREFIEAVEECRRAHALHQAHRVPRQVVVDDVPAVLQGPGAAGRRLRPFE